MDFTDLQKNLRTYLENIPYDEKYPHSHLGIRFATIFWP
jgi:hypothetical protein